MMIFRSDKDKSRQPTKTADDKTLFDSLTGYVGTVDGTTEALSEKCGERFTEGLLEKQKQRRL